MTKFLTAAEQIALQEQIAAQTVELEQLKKAYAELERKGIEQSEFIQTHGLTEFEVGKLKAQLDSLHSFAGVRALLQSILDEAYPPNTIVCSDKADADVGAQLTAAARKIGQ